MTTNHLLPLWLPICVPVLTRQGIFVSETQATLCPTFGDWAPAYSLELCIQWVYLSFSPLLFASLLFTAICKAILLLCISFSWGWPCFLSAVQCHEPQPIVNQALCLSDIGPEIYFSLPLYNQKGFDFGSNLNGLVVFPTFFNRSQLFIKFLQKLVSPSCLCRGKEKS